MKILPGSHGAIFSRLCSLLLLSVFISKDAVSQDVSASSRPLRIETAPSTSLPIWDEFDENDPLETPTQPRNIKPWVGKKNIEDVVVAIALWEGTKAVVVMRVLSQALKSNDGNSDWQIESLVEVEAEILECLTGDCREVSTITFSLSDGVPNNIRPFTDERHRVTTGNTYLVILSEDASGFRPATYLNSIHLLESDDGTLVPLGTRLVNAISQRVR